MDLPEPTESHRALERLAGHWEGTERFPPSAWSGEGFEAEATIENRVAAAGFALVGDYSQTVGGRPGVTGHAVYVYDPEDEVYEQYWFDGMGSRPMVFRGSFEAGDRLVLVAEHDRGRMRSTVDLSEPRRMRAVMEFSADGEAWSTLFEADYRIPGNPRP